MKGSAAAQATQSSPVKPRPVIEKAPKLLQLRLILVDPDALANVRVKLRRTQSEQMMCCEESATGLLFTSPRER